MLKLNPPDFSYSLSFFLFIFLFFIESYNG